MKKIMSIFLILIIVLICGFTYSNKNILSKLFGTPKNQSVSIKDNQITNYFTQTGQQPDVELINVINSSKSKLDIAIYSLTKKEIVNAIIAAKKRGINVRLIVDKQESSGSYEKKQLDLISSANIPIKVNGHKGIMHLKVTIMDKDIVTTGSYNYTASASSYNDEVLVVIDNKKVVSDFESQFERMWNDTSNFESL